MSPGASKRLGYAWCASCANCGGLLVVLLVDVPPDGLGARSLAWVHRATRSEVCPTRQAQRKALGRP